MAQDYRFKCTGEIPTIYRITADSEYEALKSFLAEAPPEDRPNLETVSSASQQWKAVHDNGEIILEPIV